MFPGIPSRIGRYEIKSVIGVGGMGGLYLAQDTNPNTRRLVALKLLNANLSSPDLRERFAREARALASLNHPNIVSIYDSGELQGAPYIVMEFVRGETLAELIRRRAPLSIGQKLGMMIELCAGLGHAHEMGIIHRDIKPANLMVDLRGCLKILDFGIARVAEGGMTHAALQMTQTNMRIGTPGYMSPEQIEGGDIDGRSDIFAVGTVFYEVLTSTAAFTGNSTRQIEDQVLGAQPVPLPSLVPGLDPEIAAIVDRALEKHPDERYQDVESLQHALKQQQWRLGPERDTPPTLSLAPLPPAGRLSRDSRAEAAYQRSLAVYHDGAVEAARRFALEALAEDPTHPGARELLEKIDPRGGTPMPPPFAPPGTAVPETLAVTPAGEADATIIRTESGSHTPPRRRPLALSLTPYAWPAAIVGVLLLIAAVSVLVIRSVMAPAGHTLTIVQPDPLAQDVAPGPAGVRRLLTITPPQYGTIVSDVGIVCGTGGSQCSAEVAEGNRVRLSVLEDAGYTLDRFTGACAPDGTTSMTEARTCGAVFSRMPASPSAPVSPPPVVARKGSAGTPPAPAPEPPPVRTAIEPRVPEPRAPEPRATDPPDANVATPAAPDTPTAVVGAEAMPARSPTAIAHDDIRKVLEAYCEAYSRMNVAAITRVHPAAPAKRLNDQFRQLKSVNYALAGAPEFRDLDLASGKATVMVNVRRVHVGVVGGKQDVDETRATFVLTRVGESEHWLIESVSYQ